MISSRWIGPSILLLLAGAAGYILTALAAGVILGMQVASGRMSLADITDPEMQLFVEVGSLMGGILFALLTVGRRYWKRWTRHRKDSGQDLPS